MLVSTIKSTLHAIDVDKKYVCVNQTMFSYDADYLIGMIIPEGLFILGSNQAYISNANPKFIIIDSYSGNHF